MATVELLVKNPKLPKDIKWHFVGALQSNKSKLAACEFTGRRLDHWD